MKYSCCGERKPPTAAKGKPHQYSATSSLEPFVAPTPSVPPIAFNGSSPNPALSNRPRLHLETADPRRREPSHIHSQQSAATAEERERMMEEVYYSNNDSARITPGGQRYPVTYPASYHSTPMLVEYQNPTSPSSNRYPTTPDLLHQKRSPLGRTFSLRATRQGSSSRTSSVRRGGGEGVEIDMEDASSRAVVSTASQREGKLSVGIDFG